MAAAGARAGQGPARVGHTQPIADARGHLLPGVPRSKASPWGTFLGTWQLPRRVPPARISLTGRSAGAAARIRRQLDGAAAAALAAACDGLRTHVTGKPQEPWPDAEQPGAPGSKGGRRSRQGSGHPAPRPAMPRDDDEKQEGAAAPLARKPARLDVRAEAAAAPEPPGAPPSGAGSDANAGRPAALPDAPAAPACPPGTATGARTATAQSAAPEGNGWTEFPPGAEDGAGQRAVSGAGPAPPARH